jgi:uncharacterized protein with NRDE domain
VCLLAFAWRSHPRYPLALAGNRDEFHHRPAGPMGWWEDEGGILAGRDLQAGGTWLGLDRDGRFAVVTNFREPVTGTSGLRSRGELVVDFLTSKEDVSRWIEDLAGRGDQYGGFNLIAGDAGRLHYLTNRGDDRLDLEPGLFGLSNHRLDTPWPKVVEAKERLGRALEGDRRPVEPLFDLLADRTPAHDDELPATGVPLEWEQLLSSAFIVSPRYGTRASTVLLVGADGRIEIEERRFDPTGECVGRERFEFFAPLANNRSL